MVWEVEGPDGAEWAEVALQLWEFQEVLGDREDLEGPWVQQTHGVLPYLKVLLLLWALVAQVVLAFQKVHPSREALEPQGQLSHQGFQVDH